MFFYCFSAGTYEESYFMQDVASSHSVRPVGAWFDEQFIGGWTGRRRTSEWPPRIPYLTLSDFILWGGSIDEVQ